MPPTEELVLRNLGYTNGIIYWMFNDCWPASLGWAFVDYYLRRKPAYYMFRRLAHDVTGSIDISTKNLIVSNTADEARAARVTVRFLDLSNACRELDKVSTSVGLDAYSVISVDVSDKIKDGVLAVVDVETEGTLYRSYYKSGKLEIQRNDSFEVVARDENSITIKALSYLQAVEFEGDYNFSDNYFTMLEGEEKTVTFEKFSDKASGVSIKSYVLK